MPTAPATATSASEPSRLVLFDGACGVCNHAVRRLLRADRDGRLFFAPLQGETAAVVRARHPALPTDLDSIVYVERDGDHETVSVRAEAIRRLVEEIDAPGLRAFRWLRYLPRSLADLGYRLFARNRHRVSRRLEACPVPGPAERARFLP